MRVGSSKSSKLVELPEQKFENDSKAKQIWLAYISYRVIRNLNEVYCRHTVSLQSCNGFVVQLFVIGLSKIRAKS